MRIFFLPFTFECIFPFETFGFQTFAYRKLISFDLIYEFLFLFFISLKLVEDILIFCLVEILFKESFGSLGRQKT